MTESSVRHGDLVAALDGRRALIMRNIGDVPHPRLSVIEALEHVAPANRALHTDRPGRVLQSAASFHSSVELVDRHEEEERAFIGEVAARLEAIVGEVTGRRLFVVAPPRALGWLRQAYPDAVRAAVKSEIDEDWVHLAVEAIARRVGELYGAGGRNMPYAANADLPDSIRLHLPEHAQSIFRAAFNAAFASHRGDARQEEAAHRIAWAAVKRSYEKVGDRWVAKDEAQEFE